MHNNLERQVAALALLCTADRENDRRRAREELRGLMRAAGSAGTSDPEEMVRELLLELGVPDHLTGHQYLVRSVALILEKGEYLYNITRMLYPGLAEEFEATPARVERSIRHAIEVAWSRGDVDVLGKYFGNTVDANKGKPTNSEFLARVVNIVRQRLKGAA